MFHWICPECGREIAPTVRECPACDPKAVVAEPALVGVVEAPTSALNVEAPARALNREAPARALIEEAPPPAPSVEMLLRAVSSAPVRFRPPEFVNLEAPAPVAPDESDDLPQLMPSPFAGNGSLAELSMVLGLLAAATDPVMAPTIPLALRAVPWALKPRIADSTPAPPPSPRVLPLPAS